MTEVVNDMPILNEFFNKRLPFNYRVSVPNVFDGEYFIPHYPKRFPKFVLVKMVIFWPLYMILAPIYVNGFDEVKIDIRDRYFDEVERILSPIILAHKEALNGRSYIKLVKRVIPE